ncbi:MAG TPA: outer membrane beta-barrel protein, partial [Burkholderiales bacterium]|nr:outer membrane beta-barrel protein [Burkholderiales bacterium]
MRILLQIVLSMALALCTLGAYAQNSPPRGGKWEFTLQPQYVHGQTFDTGNGSGGTVDSALGFGFGVAYNLNNNFSLGGDFFWNSANYNVTIAPAAGNGNAPFSASGTLQTSTIRFNGVWNIISGDFTPLIMGGIGSTYIDTNIPTAP